MLLWKQFLVNTRLVGIMASGTCCKQILVATSLFLLIVLSSCMAEFTAADSLPWVGEGPVLFLDDFSRETGGWTEINDQMSFSGYYNGGFRLWVNFPNYQILSGPGLNFRNVDLFTRATRLDGPDNNFFGLVCRYQDHQNFYAFVIGSDGYYGIYKVIRGEATLIDQPHMDFSSVINQGDNENRIRAICQDNQLALLANDVLLLSVYDVSLRFGDVGLIAGNFSDQGVDILFDDFIVMKIPLE